ncbi:hypothetical protein cypCar_00027459 [Cyprinus carpio]|nr:hypothetical protein cypCar_00027459 [Cyprinus carpio]
MNPVDSPSEDLKKLHDEYRLASVTSSMARSFVCTAMQNNTFGTRQPSESRVHSWMENVPDAADVMKDWKPPGSIQAPTDSKSIRRMSRRQCWRGLQRMDREGKALSVVTSRPFAGREVICDFHGRLISREEGLQIHQNNEAQAGHLFFFTSKNGQDLCLDAQEEHCDCHPNKSTFVR